MKKIIIAVLLTFIVPSAYASWKSGNELFIQCKSLKVAGDRKLTTQELDNALTCQEYVKGWIDGHQISGVPLVCVPQEVVLGSITDMVFNFLEENPAKRHWAAHRIMVSALLEFECPNPFKD